MRVFKGVLVSAGVVVMLAIAFRIESEIEWGQISAGASQPDAVTNPSPPTNRETVPLHEPFIPKDPVRARAMIAFGPDPIPGAIVCETHNQVVLVIDLYKEHFKERIENAVMGSGPNLIRGNPASEPELANYGCTLLRPGTVLDRLSTFGRAIQVEAVDTDGNRIKGVTDLFMVESE